MVDHGEELNNGRNSQCMSDYKIIALIHYGSEDLVAGLLAVGSPDHLYRFGAQTHVEEVQLVVQAGVQGNKI